ncbi:hypothetical protein MZE58_08670, partial [Escherichia coli]|nr:hypothetical protein [Escherichia coli]MCK2678344.1 hypothetical protein [Escherichia coli]MCK2691720.1 hypothetical protein [Escherichia coli]
ILRGVRQQQDEPGRFSICSRQAAVVLADPNDIDAISAQILQSLQDDSWREIATARGLAQAKQFSWENCATQTINAYKLL